MFKLSSRLFGISAMAFSVTILRISLSVAENANYTFVKRYALPVPSGGFIPQTICNENNMQEVEFYNWTRGVSRDYVKTNQGSTLQLQWLSAK